jgi:hypothetical protein
MSMILVFTGKWNTGGTAFCASAKRLEYLMQKRRTND